MLWMSTSLFIASAMLLPSISSSPIPQLLGWLAEKLPGSKKLPAEFQECVPILYACLEDRNAEVRKKANEAVLPFMIHCGFDTMLQKLSLVKVSLSDHCYENDIGTVHVPSETVV